MRTTHTLLGQTLLGMAMLASSAVAAVDPVLLALSPPDTKALIGVQVDQTQSSVLGQYMLSRMGPDAGLDKFATLTGFDPRRDLRQVLVASNGGQNDRVGTLIMGRGAFQPDKLAAAATVSGATKSTYSGVDLLTFKDSSQGMQTIAFLDSSTVLIGYVEGLKSAIDRFRGSVSFSGDLAQRANQASTQYQAWFVAASVDTLANRFGAGTTTGGGMPTNAFQSILTAAGELKMSADAVTFALEAVTRTDKDAQSLADVVKFLASMVTMNKNTDANSARTAALVESASITSSGATMRISLAIPEKDIETMMSSSPAPRVKRQVR